jgi:hypothetical protein
VVHAGGPDELLEPVATEAVAGVDVAADEAALVATVGDGLGAGVGVGVEEGPGDGEAVSPFLVLSPRTPL